MFYLCINEVKYINNSQPLGTLSLADFTGYGSLQVLTVLSHFTSYRNWQIHLYIRLLCDVYLIFIPLSLHLIVQTIGSAYIYIRANKIKIWAKVKICSSQHNVRVTIQDQPNEAEMNCEKSTSFFISNSSISYIIYWKWRSL